MHAVHHTQAIVLKSTSHGEANKRLWLFTREFGLIVVAVQGVRKPGAKLVSHIGDYCVIQADLVKGREVWRLISASVVTDPLSGRTREPLSRAYVRTLNAIQRFLVDEGVHEALYEHALNCAAMVMEGGYPAKEFDLLSLWRVLVHLGYVAVEERDEQFFTLSFQQAVPLVDDSAYARLLATVKQAIEQSHL